MQHKGNWNAKKSGNCSTGFEELQVRGVLTKAACSAPQDTFCLCHDSWPAVVHNFWRAKYPKVTLLSAGQRVLFLSWLLTWRHRVNYYCEVLFVNIGQDYSDSMETCVLMLGFMPLLPHNTRHHFPIYTSKCKNYASIQAAYEMSERKPKELESERVTDASVLAGRAGT